MDDLSRYSDSPAHLAVLRRDHSALRRIVADLPRLPEAGEVTSEAESIEAELRADAVSAVLDVREGIPGRETPLHVAVRLGDAVAADILMAAGADWSLQNERGWSSLQEAVCSRQDAVGAVIARHYQPLAWAKWCRRLPRIVAAAGRMRDFYMEISFHFESSVIPFISRIAPSDTYRIWKRGSNLRADMTLSGFDGFRIQRSDQSFIFFGEGGDSGRIPPGALIVLSHRDKEIANALEGAGSRPSEAEVVREVALMAQTNMYRPGIDVTKAELVPHLNWRRQDRTEAVGAWKAKVYDMHHVTVSVKSRKVPGAMTDEELFAAAAAAEDEEAGSGGRADDLLTAEERMQLDSALRAGGNLDDEELNGGTDGDAAGKAGKEKKGWFGGWGGKKSGEDEDQAATKKGGEAKKVVNGLRTASAKKKKNGCNSGCAGGLGDGKSESEYRKGLRPVLWLTEDFPLQTEELLPVLDILANKVKAVRRLRELLTTKLPLGTFPVKVAIPIVPTIRVLVTFTKFEELQPLEEFSTPLSSPAHFQDTKSKDSESSSSSSSWISWMRGSQTHASSSSVSTESHGSDDVDPFLIPADYTWIDANEKKRRMKAKGAKNKKGKKQASRTAELPPTDDFED
ncbi:Ankyrin repeat domain-containing protein 13B [Nymphaea thermarum]|nr:Ankyrin repeat domain-containing protein 13B [Nymphaea thermarum]